MSVVVQRRLQNQYSAEISRESMPDSVKEVLLEKALRALNVWHILDIMYLYCENL